MAASSLLLRPAAAASRSPLSVAAMGAAEATGPPCCSAAAPLPAGPPGRSRACFRSCCPASSVWLDGGAPMLPAASAARAAASSCGPGSR